MSAELSLCGAYRWLLTRPLVGEGPPLTFVMLNPSTADTVQDDPTIRRCINFAVREGARELRVVNLYGLRATDPKALRKARDPVGEENLDAIERACADARVVVAWGAFETDCGHFAHCCDVFCRIRKGAEEVLCLGTTKSGAPKHPLYVKANEPLIPWRPHD